MPLFILMLTVVAPLLGREYGRYLLVFYIALIPFVLSHPIPNPQRVPFLSLYIAANMLALLLHLGSTASVLNAGSLVVSILAVAGVAYYCVLRNDIPLVYHSLERWLWISLILSLFLSIALTAVSWPTAPNYFPWEALYSDKRFLLINGDGVGHTVSFWLMSFLAAFTVYRLATKKVHRAGLAALLVMLLLCLVATKSRLALLYVINLLVMGLAYKGVPLMRSFVFLIPGGFSIAFLLLSAFPMLGVGVDLAARAAQQEIGEWVRITPEKESRATVFAGRDLLNQALLDVSSEKPLRGHGDDVDILLYGVDAKGYVATDSMHTMANSESPLRLVVKYGWPYFGVLTIFLVSVPLALKRLPKPERILKVGLWGMCVESIASEGGMENFYGVSGLFLFIICLMLFEAILKPSPAITVVRLKYNGLDRSVVGRLTPRS
jgi:hypothetical protein